VSSGPSARALIDVSVPPGPAVLDLLDPLRAALSGAGPALALRAHQTPGTQPLTLPAVPDEADGTDPLAVCVTTSGSTGAAKTVLLPASALLASAAATHDRLGGAGQWLLALPGQHVAGLQVLVRSLVSRTRPAVIEPGAFTPAAFAAATEGMSPTRTRYTSLVPTQLVRLLDDARALTALRSFRAVLVGGAGTPPSLLAAARAAQVPVVTTYGMSETCGGCVYDGVPLDGVQVRLEAGRVLLSGPVLARGYLGDPVGTARAFTHDDDGARWFRTDDAGTLDDGVLSVLGRLDDMIVTGGVNVAPAPVEALLAQWPGVREAVVVGVPDPQWGHRVGAALVLQPDSPVPALDQVRARISAVLGAPSAPRQLIVLDALPLRGPGKPDRAAIAAALAGAATSHPDQHPTEGS
jgi:o-succinylbenzoate---CoA ligase